MGRCDDTSLGTHVYCYLVSIVGPSEGLEPDLPFLLPLLPQSHLRIVLCLMFGDRDRLPLGLLRGGICITNVCRTTCVQSCAWGVGKFTKQLSDLQPSLNNNPNKIEG